MTATPTLVWAQRVNKVFVTFEMIGTSNVNVSFTDGLLSLDAEAGGKKYKLENMPLWAEIDSESSKWFSNDRYDATRARARARGRVAARMSNAGDMHPLSCPATCVTS